MKILHTADWHIGQFKGPVEDGVNLRSLDTVRCLEFMVETAREVRPDLVCVSGDIFHQEQIGPVRYSDEMVTATRIIEDLAECAKFVIVMRGTPNHDGAGQFRVLTKILEKNKRVAVVTTPQVISTPIADVACIPGFDKQEFRARFPGLSSEEENTTWTQYISNMVLGLRAQCSPDREKPSILMAHYTVPGCNMESGQTSFFSNFEPVIPREALQTADYSAVLLGHIHRPQIIDGLDDVFYSGAINAMNFNDEGQSRGFWIHEFDRGSLKTGHRYETPYRKFQTITWSQEDVESYLLNGKEFLFAEGYPFMVADKIVRIKYNCTMEQKKALNIPILQSDLYEMGAFYVADIEAESMVDVANRGLLSEESDPLMNLKKWLSEKCIKDADKVTELAEPIIAAAMKSEATSENHGVLRPVSISVKNYRNYKEESFDFSDVSFCSINGVNGAGKSSLFMDAIADCLYEETREGDNKAWIRGTEDARSGSIEFVFDIGENRFRVVRTRTKSGRATLNISQKDGEEWLNLSAERIRDTQDEIEKILGMDSMTFRSCALIMQDQYGLFLQAKKEDRMTILGNLLGLSIYGLMEQEAKKLLSDTRRSLMAKKEAVKVKTEFIEEKGDPDSELAELEKEAGELAQIRKMTDQDIEVCKAQIANYKEALAKSDELLRATDTAKKELLSIQSEKETAEKEMETYDTFLCNAGMIMAKAEECEAAEETIKRLAPDVTEYEACKRTLEEKESQIQRYENIINTTRIQNKSIEDQLAAIGTEDEDLIFEKLCELDAKRLELTEMRRKKDKCAEFSAKSAKAHSEAIQKISEYSTQLRVAESRLEECKKQRDFIADSGCPDIEHATCRFLESAKKDAARIDGIEDKIADLTGSIQGLKESDARYTEFWTGEIEAVGYSPERENELLSEIEALDIYRKKKSELEERKALRARLEGEKESNDKTIGSCMENITELKLESERASETASKLSDFVEQHREAKKLEEKLRIYVTEESNIPVHEERKKHLVEKLEGLKDSRKKKQDEWENLFTNLMSAQEALAGLPADRAEKLKDLEAKKASLDQEISNLQIRKGVLMQQSEDIKTLRAEMDELKKEISVEAKLLSQYEVLKQAFSQDGVPHQIVRNIIPHITDTANNILGQMTGGTMGVEFVMEKAVKERDGDKAALDVMINEYGKTTLSYASKSGGEKVKASLAVILALSEIKASAAGVQLGMLFIDEPPFLDSDGTEAYVDALEMIRTRYPDVKIMAITHDEAMKARFSQSVTVLKTDEGSKVIY